MKVTDGKLLDQTEMLKSEARQECCNGRVEANRICVPNIMQAHQCLKVGFLIVLHPQSLRAHHLHNLLPTISFSSPVKLDA